MSSGGHISPAAEGFVTCSGQNHYIDILALAAVIQGVADFRSGGGGERVAVTRTVDGDFRYSVVKVKKNSLIFFDGFPFSCFPYSFLFLSP